jgi:hypothetical protein
MGLLSILGIAAVDNTLENVENQITFENFVVQAQNQSILTYNPGCIKGWFGKPLDKLSTGETSDRYLMLYDCLVDINIIVKEIKPSSLITWTNSYIISKTISLDAKNIQEMLEKKNSSDYNKIKTCFKIDFEKLSSLLKDYKHNPTDMVEVFGKLGGSASHNNKRKRKTKKQKKKVNHRYVNRYVNKSYKKYSA